jgi:hypothetical protein
MCRQHPEHRCPLDDWDASLASFNQFRVVVGHGGCRDDQIGSAEIFGNVSD